MCQNIDCSKNQAKLIWHFIHRNSKSLKGNTDVEWHKVKGTTEWMKTLFLNWYYAEEEKLYMLQATTWEIRQKFIEDEKKIVNSFSVSQGLLEFERSGKDSVYNIRPKKWGCNETILSHFSEALGKRQATLVVLCRDLNLLLAPGCHMEPGQHVQIPCCPIID